MSRLIVRTPFTDDATGLTRALTLGLFAVLFIPWLLLIVGSLPLHFMLKALGGRGFTSPSGRSYEVPPWACAAVLGAAILALVVIL